MLSQGYSQMEPMLKSLQGKKDRKVVDIPSENLLLKAKT